MTMTVKPWRRRLCSGGRETAVGECLIDAHGKAIYDGGGDGGANPLIRRTKGSGGRPAPRALWGWRGEGQSVKAVWVP